MKSFIGFILWFDLKYASVLIILDKCRCFVDKCALDRATNLLPRVLFVVELESYGKCWHFVNVYSDLPFRSQSLQIVWTARSIHFQSHCPYAYRKLVFSRNINIVRSINDQKRGIGKTQPKRSARQVKQGPFTSSEITFNWGLVKEGDGLALASSSC
jgi:hypothetical protein